ncbi:PfkB domain protein [Pirellula staleyi DSM 6068]|uniref:PfkB domain protein n=1 Tax=Pirellula staleyi (strain ATCC 27377 / DSM 6068 / ICPB 4128) TaxID=530564 RepID=D2R7R4_PIRSD|nr:PfkB family carbohydrate kinase [Pirellula staleyi]ADB17490.1 PfkB domain protein [Pirellula staleyi DSM 6068]
MTPRPTILAMGAVAVDHVLVTEAFPREDSKSRVVREYRVVGGCIGTAARAAAALGAKVKYAGKLGTSSEAELVLQALLRSGVDTRLVQRDETSQPIRSVILESEATHSRTVLYNLEDCAPASETWPVEEEISSSDLLLIDHFGMEGMLRAARIAAAASIPIVADFEHDARAEFVELLSLVDHLILAREFALRITATSSPAAACDALWTNARQVVAISCGNEGLYYRDRSTAKPKQMPAIRVIAQRTTGCGDVLHGAYTAAYLRTRDVPHALKFGVAAAAAHAEKPWEDGASIELKRVEQLLAQTAR